MIVQFLKHTLSSSTRKSKNVFSCCSNFSSPFWCFCVTECFGWFNCYFIISAFTIIWVTNCLKPGCFLSRTINFMRMVIVLTTEILLYEIFTKKSTQLHAYFIYWAYISYTTIFFMNCRHRVLHPLNNMFIVPRGYLSSAWLTSFPCAAMCLIWPRWQFSLPFGVI